LNWTVILLWLFSNVYNAIWYHHAMCTYLTVVGCECFSSGKQRPCTEHMRDTPRASRPRPPDDLAVEAQAPAQSGTPPSNPSRRARSTSHLARSPLTLTTLPHPRPERIASDSLRPLGRLVVWTPNAHPP
jgi:hypothetical protein